MYKQKLHFHPHITIGSNSNSDMIQKICNDFNEKNLVINCKIDTLSIITIENNFAKTIVKIDLKNKNGDNLQKTS